MKVKAYGRALFSLALFAAGWVLFFATFGMKSLALSTIGPELAPRLITIILILVSGSLSVFEIRDLRAAKAANGGSGDGKTESAAPTGGNQGWARRNAVALTMVLLAVYLTAMEYAGFFLSTACYLFTQILLTRSRPALGRIVALAALSIIIAAIIYLAFVKGLAMPLPAGIF